MQAARPARTGGIYFYRVWPSGLSALRAVSPLRGGNIARVLMNYGQSPRQTILPSFTMTTSSGVPSSKMTVGLYWTMSMCTVERAGWP